MGALLILFAAALASYASASDVKKVAEKVGYQSSTRGYAPSYTALYHGQYKGQSLFAFIHMCILLSLQAGVVMMASTSTTTIPSSSAPMEMPMCSRVLLEARTLP